MPCNDYPTHPFEYWGEFRFVDGGGDGGAGADAFGSVDADLDDIF